MQTEPPGPKPYQVFQRSDDGCATIPVPASAAVRARIRQGRNEVIPWHDTADVVRGVPTGGPYTLEVEENGQRVRRIPGLLVGDLWVLGGQSNMDGYGKLIGVEPPSSMVHAFGHNDCWAVAQDPLCTPVDSPDPVHWPCPEEDLMHQRWLTHRFRETGAGLGVRFGKEVCKATGVPIGLIVCSHGGTSMSQWDPGLKHLGGGSLYGSMLRRVQACGGRVRGMLWYQGESDAVESGAPRYKDRLVRFIHAVRTDLGNLDMPFLFVQIGRYFIDDVAVAKAWDAVRQRQLEVALEMPHTAMASAVDCSISDVIHLDAASGRKMGARMAELALALAYGKEAPLTLAPQHCAFADAARTRIMVQIQNVRGQLRHRGPLFGFSLETDAGFPIPWTGRIAGRATVELSLEGPAPPCTRLWYGRGLNPTVTLEDDFFAVPAFGPYVL